MSPPADPALVALRDELYKLMGLCLEDPGRLDAFDLFIEDTALKPEFARHRVFLRHKAASYQKALREWSSRTPPEDPFRRDLAFSELLFAHGLYFDTHEYLEAAWKKAAGERKTCLQGLIQLGAAFHKLELDPKATEGAAELLEKGLEKLGRAGQVLGRGVAPELARRLAALPALIRSGRFRFADVPELRWAPRR